MKDTLTDINNLQGINSRVDEGKMQISDLECKDSKNTQSEQQKEESKKNKGSIRSLCENFKHTNIWIIGMTQGEESKHGTESLCKKKNDGKLL